MGCVRILADNFVDTDVISNATQSSEQAAFPASNVYNKQRRSKVWRSNGYWEITASNNELVFEETSSVPLTASVAVGNYTSSTSLFAAIKTALEAAGDSTYTVSFDATTGRIKIVSNGSGGGGIFSLLTSDAGSTLAETLGYDTAVDKTGSLTAMADVLRISTGEWLQWDLGISLNPKAFVLIGARNQSIKISPSATIKLQGNETNNWTTPSYETTLEYNDSTMVVVSDTGLHTEALRYWRLLIDDLDNPNGYVEVGSVYLGDTYAPTQGIAQFPFQTSPVDRTVTVFSEGGQTFSDIREKTQEFSLSWAHLTKDECERFISIFEDVGTGVPFFMILDNDSVFSSSRNYYTRFVKFSTEPDFQLVRPNSYSGVFRLREEL